MKQEIINNQIVNKKKVDGIRRRDVFSMIPNVEYRTNIKNNVLYFGLKLIGVSIFVLFISSGFASVGSTVSYFNDIEHTFGNFMQADPLSFKVEIASSTYTQVDLSNGKTTAMPIMIPDSDSQPIQYFVKSVVTGGDSDLCNSVHMTGTWPFPYDSNLSSLITGTSTTIGAWTLEFFVSDPGKFSNKSCMVDLVYEGWNADSVYGKGYKDIQKVSLVFFVQEIIPTTSILLISSGEEEEKDELETHIDEIIVENKDEEKEEVSPIIIEESEIILEKTKEVVEETTSEIIEKNVAEPIIEEVSELIPEISETI